MFEPTAVKCKWFEVNKIIHSAVEQTTVNLMLVACLEADMCVSLSEHRISQSHLSPIFKNGNKSYSEKKNIIKEN